MTNGRQRVKGAVHVEGPKRAVDGSIRDAEGMSGAVEGSREQ